MPEGIAIYGPSFAGASLIALVHLFGHRLRFLHTPQSSWLDFLAGVALGYVFVDILPHLAGKPHRVGCRAFAVNEVQDSTNGFVRC